jgi:lipoprotein-anchoring transpeptidase ErfK/SrfK
MFPYAGFALGIAAFIAFGAQSAAAQDCFLVFCRDRPDPYARPAYPPEPQWQREPQWQGEPQRQQEQEWQRERQWQREPQQERQWQREPQWQGEPQRQQEQEWQRERQWQRDPEWQREPEYQPRPSWREPPPESYQQPYRPREPAFRGQDYAYYSRIYAEPANEQHFVAPLRLSDVDPVYLRRSVNYPTDEAPGTIVIDPQRHFLYFVEGGGRAIRYGVGVGRTGFGWSGVASVHNKQQWPDWYPPREMVLRQPEIRAKMSELQGGLGVPGGARNPLGARALYLWQGSKDTLYRIHGTVEPWTIGRNVSSGCIRMINQDVIDLYERAPIGAKVVVLSSRETAWAE